MKRERARGERERERNERDDIIERGFALLYQVINLFTKQKRPIKTKIMRFQSFCDGDTSYVEHNKRKTALLLRL